MAHRRRDLPAAPLVLALALAMAGGWLAFFSSSPALATPTMTVVDFSAIVEGAGVHLTWETREESDNDHFELYRGSSPGPPYAVHVNSYRISSQGEQGIYDYFDEEPSLSPGATYYYGLYAVNVEATAVPVATTEVALPALPTPSDTPSPTPTVTPTGTRTPTVVPTATGTRSPTATKTRTPSATPTETKTPTPTRTPSPSPTDTATATPSTTPATATATPTATPLPGTATPTDTAVLESPYRPAAALTRSATNLTPALAGSPTAAVVRALRSFAVAALAASATGTPDAPEPTPPTPGWEADGGPPQAVQLPGLMRGARPAALLAAPVGEDTLPAAAGVTREAEPGGDDLARVGGTDAALRLLYFSAPLGLLAVLLLAFAWRGRR